MTGVEGSERLVGEDFVKKLLNMECEHLQFNLISSDYSETTKNAQMYWSFHGVMRGGRTIHLAAEMLIFIN